MEHLKALIRDIPDFPKKGVTFRDITPLLRDPAGLAMAVELMANPYRGKGVEVVVGAESRGFIFGIAVAQTLSAGFIPIRKSGKLPWKTISMEYALEYGVDRLEMHEDAVRPGQRVLLVDDLIATGGTLGASCALVDRLGGTIIGCSVFIELLALKGREALGGRALHTVLRY